jgi:hypothetical protein
MALLGKAYLPTFAALALMIAALIILTMVLT